MYRSAPGLLFSLLLLGACSQAPVPVKPADPANPRPPLSNAVTMSTRYDDWATAVTYGSGDAVTVAGVQTASVYGGYGSIELDSTDTGAGYGMFARGVVARYGRDGPIEWSQTFDLPCPKRTVNPAIRVCYTRLSHVATDAQGRSYVLAEVMPSDNFQSGRFQTYLYTFGPAGKLLDRKLLFADSSDSRPQGLAVSADGTLYLAWLKYRRAADPDQPSTFEGLQLTAFSPQGNTLWEQTFEVQGVVDTLYWSSSPIGLADVTLGADGSLYFADFTTLYKISSAGELLWSRDLPYTPPKDRGGDEGDLQYGGVSVKASDAQVYVGRSVETFGGYNEFYGEAFELFSWNQQGQSLWQKRLGDRLTQVDDVHMATSAAAGLFVAGTVRNRDENDLSVGGAFVRQLSAAGETRWTSTFALVGTLHALAARTEPGEDYGAIYLAGEVMNYRCNEFQNAYYCPNKDAFVSGLDYQYSSSDTDWIQY